MKKFIKKIIYKIRGVLALEQLKERGLKYGSNFQMSCECIIDPSFCHLIEIGDNVTLAPRVHILAHDASTKNFLNYTKIATVIIENNVFVGAGSIILPGVHIGKNCIIGAGSVISKNIPENSVVVGNPCRIISKTEQYLTKEKENMKKYHIFDETYTSWSKDGKKKSVSEEKKVEMKKKLKTTRGFVV